MKNYLDRYLAGETPLHPERLGLPTDEELDAAEAEFDRIMAEREPQAVAEDKPRGRVVSLWPWAAAASVLLLIGVLISLSPTYGPQGGFTAKQDTCSPLEGGMGGFSGDSVQQQEPTPVIPLETADSIKKLKEKYRMPRPPKHCMAKAETGGRSQETGVGRQESGVGSQESGGRRQETGAWRQETGVRSQETGVIDEQALAERAFAEEKMRIEMEMMAQMSSSLQADFKAMTDEIRNRGERMSQHVEIAMSNEE